jgi:hypothetical protein
VVVLGVETAAVWIGLALFVASGAVAGVYVIHLRLLGKQVRRVQRERSLATRDARLSREADPENGPEFDRPSAPVLGLSSAQLLGVRDARLRHKADTAQHSFAHDVDG